MKKGKILSLILATLGALAVTLSFAACGTTPDDKETPHTHTFAAEWTSDETNHWHKATCEHKDEKSGLAAHTFNGTECTVCGYPAPVAKKCNCETECELCPVCGGCIQTDCTDENCIKCGDGLVAHEFEAIEAKLTPGKNPNDSTEEWPLTCRVHECTYHKVGVGRDDKVMNVEKHIQGISGNNGGTVTWELTCNKKTVATLKILCTSSNVPNAFTDNMRITVNNELVERPTKLGSYDEKYDRKSWFNWIDLGCIELEEGLNKITLIAFSPDPGVGCNLARINVLTEEGVTLGFTPMTAEDNNWKICNKQA